MYPNWERKSPNWERSCRPSRKRTPESRAAKPSSRGPRTHQGAPPRGPARQDRWPRRARRGFKTAHCSQRRGRRAVGAALPLRRRPQMTPGSNLMVLPLPDRTTGPGPMPSEQPEDVQAHRIKHQPPGSLRSNEPRPGKSTAIPRPVPTYPIRRVTTTRQGYVPFRYNHAPRRLGRPADYAEATLKGLCLRNSQSPEAVKQSA